jgi:hypothetical protein
LIVSCAAAGSAWDSVSIAAHVIESPSVFISLMNPVLKRRGSVPVPADRIDLVAGLT